MSDHIQALITEDTLDRLIDPKQIYENARLLSKQDEGSVYLTVVSNWGKEFILKERRGDNSHEFLVGSKIAKTKHPNFANVIMYFACPCSWLQKDVSFILMEQVPGVSLEKHYNDSKLNGDTGLILLRHVILALVDLQGRIPFTHYDLHSENIIITELDSEEVSTYTCFGKEYTISSPFRFKIIDYGYSYIEGVERTWCECNGSVLFSGGIPNVYDSFFDLAYFFYVICNAYSYRGTDIFDLMEKNSFVPRVLSENYFEYQYIYRGREFNPEWYSLITSPTLTTINDYANNLYYINPKTDPRTLKEFEDEATNILQSMSPRNEERNKPIIMDLKKQLAGVMKGEKERKMAKRTVTTQQFFNKILEFTNL